MIAGRALSFKAPLSAYARGQVPRAAAGITYVSAVLVVPEGWDIRPRVPLLIVCSPSGAPAIPSLAGYTNAALAEGWAVLAADGPPVPFEQDTVMWNWGAVGSALAYVHTALPTTRRWPVAVGGFSGGAKRAACVAAAALQARYELIGIFLGGCNEDRASTGMLLFSPGPQFLKTPVFLGNGDTDPIAGPAHGAAVRASLERSGFSRLRAEVCQGGHRLEPLQVREALAWFAGSGKPSP